MHDTEVARLLVQLGFAEVDHHVLIAGGDLERGHQKGEEKHQGGLATPPLQENPCQQFLDFALATLPLQLSRC